MGKFLQRTTFLYYDHYWRTGRFELGFADQSSQTLRIIGRWTGNQARFGSNVRIKFSGTVPNKIHCDNTDERYLTLRSGGQPSVVVNEFKYDEQLWIHLISTEMEIAQLFTLMVLYSDGYLRAEDHLKTQQKNSKVPAGPKYNQIHDDNWKSATRIANGGQ